MELEKIVFLENSYNQIAAILDQSFGEIEVGKLTDETFAIFVAASIKAAYKIGFRDGVVSATPVEK